MEKKMSPKELQQLFEQKASQYFAKQVPAYNRIKMMVKENGGYFRGDHIAIRTTDVRVAEILQEVMYALDMYRAEEDTEAFPYRFPNKLLKSFDLLGEDHRGLALFVSVWDKDETQRLCREAQKSGKRSKAELYQRAIQLIEEDAEEKWKNSRDYYTQALAFANLVRQRGGLTPDEADNFTDLLVNKIFARNGPLLKEETFQSVAKIGGELASAMILGEGINHFTVDVTASNYNDTESMRKAVIKAGMKTLPSTLGKDGELQQSATLGEDEVCSLLSSAGKVRKVKARLRFMEFIHRQRLYDDQGKQILLEDEEPARFRRFVGANADNIFASAKVD